MNQIEKFEIQFREGEASNTLLRCAVIERRSIDSDDWMATVPCGEDASVQWRIHSMPPNEVVDYVLDQLMEDFPELWVVEVSATYRRR